MSENRKYGPVEARHFTTQSGSKGIAARDGEIKSNTVFGKPEAAGISYVGFLMDAAGDFSSQRSAEQTLKPGEKIKVNPGGSIFL